MDSMVMHAVNAVATWAIVVLSVLGYFLTVKRTGQRWLLWVVLAAGWSVVAVPNTLSAIGVFTGEKGAVATWLASYVLIMASLLLMFLKMIELMDRKKAQ